MACHLQPLVSLCGTKANAPNLQAAANEFSVWSFESQSLQKWKEQNLATKVTSADLR